jgi:hypothetical protein
MRRLFAAVAVLLCASIVHAGNVDLPYVFGFEDGTRGSFSTQGGTGSAVVTDSTAPEGSKVLRFKYPQSSSYGGYAPDRCTVYFNSTASEIYAQWWFKYSSGFRWNTITNKMVYVLTGTTSADVNFTVMTHHYNTSMSTATQHPSDSSLNQTFKPSSPTISTGVWYKAVLRAKMNTAGQNDGIYQLWINDVLVTNQSNVLYRRAGQSALNFIAFRFDPVYGGGPEAIPSEQYLYVDGVRVQTTPIGTGGGGEPEDTSPPYVDTFSPADGATNVAVDTTSFSFHFKDSGTGASGTDNLVVDCPGFGGAKTCAAGLTCTGGEADLTVTYGGLSLGYDDAVSCTIDGDDDDGNTMGQYTYNFTVESESTPPVEILTTSLPGGTVGDSYQAEVNTNKEVSGYPTYSIVSGSLPPGVTLSQWMDTAVFSGPLLAEGTYAFVLNATVAATGSSDNQALSIVVAPNLPGGQTTTQATTFADTYIGGSNSGENFHDNAFLRVYQWPMAVVANRTIIMDNTDILAIPANVSVTSAKLRLYLTGNSGSGGTNPMRVFVYRILEPVDTTTVTGANWAGTLSAPLSYANVGLTPGWIEWDILSAVQAAYAAQEPLYLALDGGGEGSQDTNRIFASVDHETEAYRPEVILTFTQLTGPGGTSIGASGKGRSRAMRGFMGKRQ